MGHPDLEDRIFDAQADALNALFGWLTKNAWEFADKTFKLVSWMLAIGALNVLFRTTKNDTLGVVVPFLVLIWVVAASVVIMKAGSTVVDDLSSYLSISVKGARWTALAVRSFVVVIAGWLTVGVLLPFSTNVLLSVVDIMAKSPR